MDTSPIRVELESDGNGLAIRWEPAGDDEIEIGLGPSPDVRTHTTVLRLPAGATSGRIDEVPSGRPYVSVSRDGTVVIAAERRVRLGGTLNFRDLGGYLTASGGRTRWGQLFRSSSLHKLTTEDLDVLDSLGVRTIYDLRSEDERTKQPGPRPAQALPVPLRFTEVPDLSPLRERSDGEQWLADDYRAMLHHGGPVFGRLLTDLAEADRTPAVFHCAGGKDRTGLATALLLSALGVDRETVLDDYALTDRYLSARDAPTLVDAMVEMGITRPAAEGLLSTPRWVMVEALSLLDNDYGGPEGYLRGPARIPASVLDDLRTRFVD